MPGGQYKGCRFLRYSADASINLRALLSKEKADPQLASDLFSKLLGIAPE